MEAHDRLEVAARAAELERRGAAEAVADGGEPCRIDLLLDFRTSRAAVARARMPVGSAIQAAMRGLASARLASGLPSP
jgi:hypothetical protein